MRKSPGTRRIVLAMALAVMTVLSACQTSTGPTGDLSQGTGGSTGVGVVTGKVLTMSGSPLSGVEVRVGTRSTYTNSKGEYFLDQVPSGTRVLVNFRNDAFVTTQKITPVIKGRATWLDAAMQTIGVRATLNATGGGTVTMNGGATVVFQPNALVDASGAAFTGTAQVKATWCDPSQTRFTDCFPGEFSGVRTDGSETGIESFGFVNVEILNGTSPLQLAAGKPSTITFPIPTALRARAPQTIPLWYYDEVKGQWIEQGSANKVGNNYVGSVTHFSNWNCDQPNATSYLEGRVVDGNGNPLSFATVKHTGVDYTGSSRTVTDGDGRFKLAVKSSATARVVANYYIVSSAPKDVPTPPTGQSLDIGTIVIPVDTSLFCSIIGRVVDNGGKPLAYMQVILQNDSGRQIDYLVTSQDGRFRFFGEAGRTYTVEAAWYADSAKQSKTVQVTCPTTPGTVDVGDIKVDIGGAYISGRVVDGSGAPIANTYIVVSGNGSSGGQNRETPTGPDGRFTVSVRPNVTVTLHFYANQKSKTLDVTTPALGETKDIGDVTVQ